jgi:8-oxo-dGTP pyrophosphatase MutT (NUDIX family)
MSSGFDTLGDWSDAGKLVAAIILIDHHNRILLQLRDINARTVNPGVWGFFGGHVEPGETLEIAAYREFEEETGVTLEQGALKPFARTLSLTSAQLHCYTATQTIEPQQIRLVEGSGFAFFTRAQIKSLPLTASANTILHHFFEKHPDFR